MSSKGSNNSPKYSVTGGSTSSSHTVTTINEMTRKDGQAKYTINNVTVRTTYVDPETGEETVTTRTYRVITEN